MIMEININILIWILYVFNKAMGATCADETSYEICEGQTREIMCEICENNGKEIICEDGEVIHIITASYGRRTTDICPHRSIITTTCHAESSMGKVETECNRKNKCKICATNDIFGDPCEGTYKYLSVNYTCNDATETETTTFQTETDTDNKTTNTETSRLFTEENSSTSNTIILLHNTTSIMFTVDSTTTFLDSLATIENYPSTTNSIFITRIAMTRGPIQQGSHDSTGQVVGGTIGAVGVVAIILIVVGILLYRKHKPAEEQKANSINREDSEYVNIAFQDDFSTASYCAHNQIQEFSNDKQQYTSLNKNAGVHEPTYSSLENSDVYTNLQNSTFGNATYNTTEHINNGSEYTPLNLPNNIRLNSPESEFEPTYNELEQNPSHKTAHGVQPACLELEGKDTMNVANTQPIYFQLEEDKNMQLKDNETSTKNHELENTSSSINTDVSVNSYPELESTDPEKEDYAYAYSHFSNRKDEKQEKFSEINDSAEMIDNDIYEMS